MRLSKRRCIVLSGEFVFSLTVNLQIPHDTVHGPPEGLPVDLWPPPRNNSLPKASILTEAYHLSSWPEQWKIPSATWPDGRRSDYP
jgi:hypothetical protein